LDVVKGKVVLITGASRGIGRETARLFSKEGAALVLCAREGKDLREAADETGARAVACDVSKEAEVRALFVQVASSFGKADIVVNNAGVFRTMPILDTTAEIFDEVIGMNLRAVFLVSREALRLMSGTGGGLIINISSMAGKRGYEGSAAYCASKFGVVGLSRVLAMEGRAHGVRVTVVYPGAVDTAMWDGIVDDRAQFLTPGDVARAVLFAASSRAGSTVGEIEITPL
jgi:NAD(P)-dependent dehydrogenase (short-subunit alcohol dehydrogenase family)